MWQPKTYAKYKYNTPYDPIPALDFNTTATGKTEGTDEEDFQKLCYNYGAKEYTSKLRATEQAALGPTRRRRQQACEAGLRDLLADRSSPGSWRDRELAARPALQSAAAGRAITGRTTRRRNAA